MTPRLGPLRRIERFALDQGATICLIAVAVFCYWLGKP